MSNITPDAAAASSPDPIVRTVYSGDDYDTAEGIARGLQAGGSRVIAAHWFGTHYVYLFTGLSEPQIETWMEAEWDRLRNKLPEGFQRADIALAAGGTNVPPDPKTAGAVTELVQLLDTSPAGIVDVPPHNALWRSPGAEFTVARSALADLTDDELHARAFVSVYDNDGRKHVASQHAPGWLDAAMAETPRPAIAAVQRVANVAIAAAEYVVVGLGWHRLTETRGDLLVYLALPTPEAEAETWREAHADQLDKARPTWATGHTYVNIVDGRGVVDFSADMGRITVETFLTIEGDTWTPGQPTLILPPELPATDAFALAADLVDAAIATLAPTVDDGTVAGWHLLAEALRSEGGQK